MFFFFFANLHEMEEVKCNHDAKWQKEIALVFEKEKILQSRWILYMQRVKNGIISPLIADYFFRRVFTDDNHIPNVDLTDKIRRHNYNTSGSDGLRLHLLNAFPQWSHLLRSVYCFFCYLNCQKKFQKFHVLLFFFCSKLLNESKCKEWIVNKQFK